MRRFKTGNVLRSQTKDFTIPHDVCNILQAAGHHYSSTFNLYLSVYLLTVTKDLNVEIYHCLLNDETFRNMKAFSVTNFLHFRQPHNSFHIFCSGFEIWYFLDNLYQHCCSQPWCNRYWHHTRVGCAEVDYNKRRNCFQFLFFLEI